MTVFNIAVVARATAENDDIHNIVHLYLQLLVDVLFIRNGKIAQMNRNGRVLKEGRHEILINLFRNERHEWCRQLGQGHENGVQRGIRRFLIFRPFAAPISVSAASDVPVAEVVGKVLNGTCGIHYFVIFQTLVHRFDESIEFAQYPPVHQ